MDNGNDYVKLNIFGGSSSSIWLDTIKYGKATQLMQWLDWNTFCYSWKTVPLLETSCRSGMSVGDPITATRVGVGGGVNRFADLLMSGFESRSYGVISDRSAHSATTSFNLKNIFSIFGQIKIVWTGRNSNWKVVIDIWPKSRFFSWHNWTKIGQKSHIFPQKVKKESRKVYTHPSWRKML